MKPNSPAPTRFQNATDDEEVDRPPVLLHPRLTPRQPQVLPRLEADEHQRHDLERAEHRPERQHERRRAGEVEVMQRADDAARQEDRRRQHGRFAGGAHADELQAREEERDHDGGEDLEEALDPQVHDPPAPVLGHRQMRVPAVAERGHVEDGDGDASRSGTASAAAAARLRSRSAGRSARTISTSQRNSPTSSGDLPEAPEVDVLVAL